MSTTKKTTYTATIPTVKPLDQATSVEVIKHLSDMLLKSYFTSEQKNTWSTEVSEMLIYLTEDRLSIQEIFHLIMLERSK